MTEDGPTYCDVRDAKAREQHKPFSCPDKTLTAFCQLGALRLKARRCLLFFFGVDCAYAMAEATQSLSLEDDNAHDLNDHLWLGHATIPRNIACCETTVNLPSFSPSSSTANGERDSVFIVNDLTKNPQTSDRPFVTGFPHGRFYVGVPITSMSGINIGAYCILDDEPRDGVSDKDVMFLRDMSRTVMTHLETIRAQAERERATQMVTGLGAFVKRSSGSRLWEGRYPTTPATRSSSADNRTQRPGFVSRRSHRSIRHSAPAVFAENAITDIPYTTDVPQMKSSGHGTSQITKSLTQSKNPNSTKTMEVPDVQPASPGVSIGASTTSKPHASKLDIKNERSPSPEIRPQLRKRDSDVRSIYQRASEIMCDSLSVDGVAFADASAHAFGGLAETVDTAGNTNADISTCDESETSSMNSRPSTPSDYAKGDICQLLGCAESLHDESPGSSAGQPAMKLTDSFLRHLLRRHPQGKIWSFSALGQVHSDNLSTGDYEVRESIETLPPAGVQQHIRGQIDVRTDAEILAYMFPGARSIAVHGIRDASRRRWTAGCILWSYDPLRVLTADTEMNLVAAFCDIIAGETRRLEIQRSDKAKSDFISSISHELR